MLHPKLCTVQFLLFMACVLLSSFVFGHNEPNPRGSFFLGSRYGRSVDAQNAAPLFASSKTRRLNLQPRNDGFFIGSRYGKRTQAVEIGNEPTATENKSVMSSENQLSCIYTGVTNLYRCNKFNEIDPIMSQLTDGPNNEYNKK